MLLGMSSDVNETTFGSSTFLVKRAIWWQNYLVKKKPFLPIDMHTKNCTNLKIYLAAKDYQKLLGSSLVVTILFLRRPSTEVTCFDDIDQTRPVLPGPLTIHHLTVIWPFQPKKYLMTFSYPWAKVNILEYEMQHWNLTKLIFESSKSQKNLVRLSSLTQPGISKEPWWLHPPPTFYRFVIPSLIWYLSYWCLIRSHSSSHSRWDLKYDWTSSVNQTTFLNRNLILLILSNVEKCCLQNPTMSNNIVQCWLILSNVVLSCTIWQCWMCNKAFMLVQPSLSLQESKKKYQDFFDFLLLQMGHTWWCCGESWEIHDERYFEETFSSVGLRAASMEKLLIWFRCIFTQLASAYSAKLGRG